VSAGLPRSDSQSGGRRFRSRRGPPTYRGSSSSGLHWGCCGPPPRLRRTPGPGLDSHFPGLVPRRRACWTLTASCWRVRGEPEHQRHLTAGPTLTRLLVAHVGLCLLDELGGHFLDPVS
jgi:hypothetical protein